MFGKRLVFLGAALLGASLLAGCGGSAPKPVSVSVAATAGTVDGTDSVTLTATVANDKNSAGVTWSVSGGGVLSNQSTTSAVYTAPAASSSVLNVTATATSIADTTQTGSVTLTVPAAPAIATTSTQLASSVGSAYAVTLAGSGGIAPYTWAATGLPACLTLNKTTGLVSGTILASCAGTSTPTFTLTDSGVATALTASAQLNLVIAAAPAISFTGTVPPSATTDIAYSGSAAASGGVVGSTLTYSTVGTWPSWLSLNSSTGAISGTPTAAGPVSFSVQAGDAYGDTATQKYTITVGKGTPSVSVWPTASGITYGQTLSASTLSGGSASVAGSFAWTTPSTAPGVGTATYGVTFTPTDTTDFTTTTGTVSVTVSKATPSVSVWPTASGITYGQTLSSSTLSGGSASVAGSFAWTTPSLTPGAGTASYNVTFTPTDSTNYAAVTQTVSLAVSKATLTVTASSTTVAYGSAVPTITPIYSGFLNSDTAAALTTAPTCSTTYTPTSAAGTSPATSCSGGVSSNYIFNYVSGTVTVTKNTPTVTWTPPAAITYGTALSATQLNATATVTGTFAYTPALGTVLGAGSQTLSVTFTPTNTTDYSAVTQTVSLLVNKATLTVTASSTTVAYGSAIPTITPIYSGFQNGDTVAVVTTVPTCTTTYTPTSTVGSSQATSCSGAAVTSNYSLSYVSGTVTVTKGAPPVVTWSTPAAITYGTALSATQLNATASVAGSFVYTPAAGTVLGAGSQTLSVTFNPTDATDYSSVTQTVSLLVNKAALTVTASSPTVAFGSAVPTITPIYSGFQNGDTVAVVATAPTCSTTYTPASTVGSTPTTSCSGGVVSSNYSLSYVTGTVTVTKASPALTWPTPVAITYGTAVSATQLNATSTVAGTFAYTPASGVVLGAGSQTLSVTFTPSDTSDYSAVTQTVSLQVNKATLTVTASSTTVTYGSAVPAITPSYSGFLNGDTVTALTTAPTCSTTYTPTSAAGTSPATNCSGGVSSNYSFSYVSGTVTITKGTPAVTWTTPVAITYGTALSATQLDATATVAGTYAYTPALGTVLSAGSTTLSVTFTPGDATDYSPVTQTVLLQVNQATLTVTASSLTVAFGSAVPTITPIYSGFQNGDTVAVVTTAPTCSTTYTTTSAAGSMQTTSCSGAAITSNYILSYVSGTVTVTKATPAVTWTTPAAITYGTALSATQLNATSTLAGNFAYTPALGTVLGAGSQTLSVTFNPTDKNDYASITQTVLLQVSPATLTVTASSPTVAFGSAVPTITPIYSGFQNGDTVAVVISVPTCSTTYTPTSAVGSVQTTSCLGGAVSTNYILSYISGTVTVTKGTPPAVTWTTPAAITYGTPLSATQLDATTTVAGNFVYTPAAGTVLGAGSQTLSVTFNPNDTTDYSSVTQTVSLLVNKATLTVTASSTTVAFGAAIPTITPIYSGFQNGDTVAVVATPPSCSTTYTPTSAAGSTQTSNCTGGVVNLNYILSYVSGTVTVTKGAPPAVTWPTPVAITYGTALSAAQLNATSTVAGTFAYTPALGTVLSAGSQTLSVTFTPSDTNDYSPVTQTVSLQVNQATLTVTASSPTVAFGSAVPTITPIYSGFQNGDTAAVVTTAPTCSTTYTTTSAVGSTQTTNCTGGAVNSNYILSYVSGTVTVVNFGISAPSTLPTGYINSPYQTTLTAIGGVAPFNWAVSSGNPPAGLNLSSACTNSSTQTCVLSGTPSGPTGTTTFTVSVIDSVSNAARLPVTITIGAGIAITTATPLTAGLQGTVYPGETLTATGGTGAGSYTWTWAAASGSLPAGMTLNKTTGAIGGTPTVSGTFSIVVTVTDTASNTASANFTLIVYPPLSITTTSLPGGTANTAYTSTQFAATGGSGNYIWSWTAASGSSLPGGMTFLGGLLAGTPTAHGNYSVIFTVKDATLNVTSSATLPIVIAYAPLSFTTTPASLPSGTVNTVFTNTQFAAAGGSGSYTWSSSPLPGGMNLSVSGLLSGTPTTAGSYPVQVTLTDATASSSLTATFTINVDSSSFTITTATTLPIDYVGSLISKTLATSGGTGSGHSWKLVSGTLPSNVTLSTAGLLSGEPSASGVYVFTVEATDSGGNQAWATFSLTVVQALSISTTVLTSGTVGVPYSQTLAASGGSGSYSWGWAAVSGSLPAGLTLSSSGTISGTPNTANGYTVKVTVTDTGVTPNKSVSNTFTLQVISAGVSINGQISLANNCAGATSVPSMAVTLVSNTAGSTFQPTTTTTDSNGNYVFANLPSDSYTIIPSLVTPASGTAPSSIFFPAAQIVTLGSSSLNGENFSVALGYAVSGYVNYSGTQSGQVYLVLNASNCGSYGALGTSIVYPFTSGGAFTINGVPPGTYTLQAWMDNSGSVIPGGIPNGVPNVINPTGSSSSLSVTNDLLSSAAVTLTDPTVTAVSNSTPGPTLNMVSPTDQGVAISFSPVTNASTSKVEAVTSYQVQWNTSSTFPSGTNSSYTYAANGKQGVWILNNGLPGLSGTFSNGTTYYFRARGVLAGNKTAWTYYGGSSNPTSVTIGAPPSNGSTSNIQGVVGLPTINTSTGVSIASYGPLYVGYYEQSTGAIYADRIANPSNPQSFSVNVPDASDYIFFAILDQNNDGLINTGDITNTNGAFSSPVTIDGDMSLSQYELAANNSTATATTQMTQSTNLNETSTTTTYGLNLQVLGGLRLPVAVELLGPSYAYLIAPVDFSACTSCGNAQFDYQLNIPNIASESELPSVGDNFPLQVTYSDGTTDSAVYAQVSGVGATATSSTGGTTTYTTVAASDLQLSGASTTPNFGWSDPNNASNYTYSFSLNDSSGNIIWQIPSSNSKENGFDSSITLIQWGTDPTGNTNNQPSLTSLTPGAVYTWSIQVVDSNGNSSTTQVSFQP